MDLLEEYYAHPPQIESFVPRKITIPPMKNLNLFGVRGSGKSAIIYDYIQNCDKNILYIDLEDPRLIIHGFDTLPIDEFIEDNEISELILDHYEDGILEFFPKVDRLIIVSRQKQDYDKFDYIQLLALEYEEFLAFDTNGSDSVAFNHFLKSGTLPSVASHQKSISIMFKQFFQQQFLPNEQSLLLILARYNTQPLTTHQIYSLAKEYFKISKDFIYSAIKRFELEGIIYFIDNDINRSGKKMILYDFAFARFLSTTHTFASSFDAMVAISLINHKYSFKTLGIYGYITSDSELIIPSPFESEDSMWVKSQKNYSLYQKHNISKITILTVSNSYRFEIDKITFEALPYREWAIMDKESNL
jgi:hypothetical protein